jgi:hypothetical protein
MVLARAVAKKQGYARLAKIRVLSGTRRTAWLVLLVDRNMVLTARAVQQGSMENAKAVFLTTNLTLWM